MGVERKATQSIPQKAEDLCHWVKEVEGVNTRTTFSWA